MATIDTYKLKFETAGVGSVQAAKKAVDDTDKSVNKLQSSLSGLGSIVAGIGFGAFITNLARTADALNDVSQSTGLAVDYLYNFSQATEAAGGSFEGAATMLQKFNQLLLQGSEGVNSAEEALNKVGIQVEDLDKIGQRQILENVLEELSKLPASAERSAKMIEYFGKQAANVDPRALLETLRAMKPDPATAQALQNISTIIGNLETSFRNLQQATLKVFGPLLNDIKDLKISSEQAETAIKIVAAGLAAITAAKVVGGLAQIVTLFQAFNKALKVNTILQTGLTALQGPKGLLQIAAGAAAATAAYYALNKVLEDTESKQEAAVKAGAGQVDAPAVAQATRFTEQEADARRQAALAAKQTTEQLIKQNQEANRLREITIGTIGLENERANLIKANAAAESQANNDIAQIRAKINEEIAKGRDANQAVINELAKQIIEKTKQLAVTKELNQQEYNRLAVLRDQQKIFENIDQRTQSTADAVKDNSAKELQLKLATGKINKEEYDRQIKLGQIINENLKTNQALNEKIAIAQANGDKVAEESLLNQMRLEKQRYDQVIQNLENEDILRNIQTQSQAAGTRAALDSIAKNFEPYTMAQNRVLQGWNAIDNAISNFVKTGKLNFKDLAASFIQSILEMELKAQAFELYKSVFGTPGGSPMQMAMAGAGGGPGLGTNQFNPIFVKDVGAPAGIPGINGTGDQTQGFFGQITDMFGKLGSYIGNIFGNIGNSIGSLFSGFGGLFGGGGGLLGGLFDFIGGFFADGGNPPVGKASIVGEKGPELFVPKQAGTIIPNNKLAMAAQATGTGMVNAPVTNNYNTYNISALDAKSVAQLFAENRKSLLGATEMARKEMPYGGR